jgi:DNA mismatch repair protein MSH2
MISDDIYQLDHKKLSDILHHLNITETLVPRSYFKTSNVEQDLTVLMNPATPILSLPEMELTYSLFAVACLIQKLDLLGVQSNHGEYSLNKIDLTQYMRLDSAAVKALHLVPGPKDGNNKTMNLFGLLNQCKTSQGSRLLSQWIKQPLLNVTEINVRQDLVAAMFEDINLRHSLEVILNFIKGDLLEFISRFIQSRKEVSAW